MKSAYAREQIEEERIKAKILTQRPELAELIWKTEDNELLRGRISFVLDCIGYKDNPETLDVKLLQKVQGVFKKYFNDEDGLSNLFRRAMLTISVDGRYDCYEYWWSSWTVVSGTVKRRIFVTFRELEYYIYNSAQSEYFKKLVLKLTKKDYAEIINEFTPPDDMPNWKVRLIKEDNLLKKKCASCYIAIADDNSYCYLLRSQRPRERAGNPKIT